MKMSVARAMKERCRIVKKMDSLRESFLHNVYIEGRKPQVDVGESLNSFIKLQNSLIELKQKIAEANSKSGVIGLLYEKDELRTRWVLFRGIPDDTESQFNRNPVTGVMEEQKKSAFLTHDYLVGEIDDLASKIDELQDKIDELNATTFIEFDSPLV